MSDLYTVRIKTPNKVIFLRGKLARSPVTFFKVTEQELTMLNATIRFQAIDNFIIEPYNQDDEQKIKYNIENELCDNTKIEELDNDVEPSLLETFLKDE